MGGELGKATIGKQWRVHKLWEDKWTKSVEAMPTPGFVHV